MSGIEKLDKSLTTDVRLTSDKSQSHSDSLGVPYGLWSLCWGSDRCPSSKETSHRLSGGGGSRRLLGQKVEVCKV